MNKNKEKISIMGVNPYTIVPFLHLNLSTICLSLWFNKQSFRLYSTSFGILDSRARQINICLSCSRFSQRKKLNETDFFYTGWAWKGIHHGSFIVGHSCHVRGVYEFKCEKIFKVSLATSITCQKPSQKKAKMRLC